MYPNKEDDVKREIVIAKLSDLQAKLDAKNIGLKGVMAWEDIEELLVRLVRTFLPTPSTDKIREIAKKLLDWAKERIDESETELDDAFLDDLIAKIEEAFGLNPIPPKG